MKCRRCGCSVHNDVLFCPNCGDRMISSNKDNHYFKIVLIVLFILFFGGVGFFVADRINKGKGAVVNEDTTQFGVNEESVVDSRNSFSMFDVHLPKVLKDGKDLSKNIEISDIYFNPYYDTYGSYNKAFVYGKNNNSIPVKVVIEIEYYDRDGYRIARSDTSEVVSANGEYILGIDVKKDDIGYHSAKMFYSAKKVESYYTVYDVDKFSFNSEFDSVNNYGINTSISNIIANNSVTFVFGCLYYKDGKVVFADSNFIFDLKPLESSSVMFYSSRLKLEDSTLIEYDDYKVFLISSYFLDSENY